MAGEKTLPRYLRQRDGGFYVRTGVPADAPAPEPEFVEVTEADERRLEGTQSNDNHEKPGLIDGIALSSEQRRQSDDVQVRHARIDAMSNSTRKLLKPE